MQQQPPHQDDHAGNDDGSSTSIQEGDPTATLSSSASDQTSTSELALTEEENQIVYTTTSLVLRAIDLKYRILNLANSQISDKIMNTIQDVLNGYVRIESLTAIWELNLAQNSISILPTCLTMFTRVERVFLNENQLSSIPEDEILTKLVNCKIISFSNNLLTNFPINNPFPKYSLTKLTLSNNQIQFLPKYIGECVNLVEIDLSHNNLKTIPKEIENCKKLMRLFIDHNPLICLPYELRNLSKLRTFRCDSFNIEERKRFYQKMCLKHDSTLLEFAKRFIVNSDHQLCHGKCCQVQHDEESSPMRDIHDMDMSDDDHVGAITIASSTTSVSSSRNKETSFECSSSQHFKLNFDLLKAHYKSTVPKHLLDDLIDHTRMNCCSTCNQFMSQNTGINFIALSKLPTKSKHQLEQIPLFCRACSTECFSNFPNKII
ncbi:hypothetical protein C9374_010449 [Naegleria lovaniensis]|uniref:Uncharacterized protein n=1 Tax=Naegleria lovaniensis TaxID=51637 RepID=A0AA88KDG9_NAELO|nr:uncharacterized protein C9374_010449 [Naegleria lovaniensis]KAG2374705.1 hypothetical protein C9374_010449 [Naegleria lovaniensis]